jgi:hypothetical protein
MNTIPFRKRASLAWASRGSESGPAYAEYLRERFPMGSVVAINLVTGKYVVGGASPQALHMYPDKFGKKAQPNMWLEPIHWPNTRLRDEEIAEMAEWFKERRRSRRKRC